MYLPGSFREDQLPVLQEFIYRHPLAFLVTVGPEGLEANPVPVLHDPAPKPGAPYGVLRGHLARANPQWQHYRPETEALALFQGPQAYISPNWYPSKAEHGKAVPTWNYTIVEAKGSLTIYDDPAWLRRLLNEITAAHETGQATPWSLDQAPVDFLAAQLQAVVGIEIAIKSLTGKWKMSQNKSVGDRQGVESALAAGNEAQKAVSHLVGRARRPNPSP